MRNAAVGDGVSHRGHEETNILQIIKRRKATGIGHIVCRNCPLKLVLEGKVEGRIEVTRRRGRRYKQLLVELNGTRRYWILKDEALDLFV